METFNKEKLKEISQKEAIVKIIHRHWFNILIQFLIVFGLAVLLFMFLFIIPSFLPFFQEENVSQLIYLMGSMFAMFIWLYGFFIWIDYYFDIWIITEERIINIEQKGLFIRSMSEVKFNRIQDVTAEEKGAIPTMLDYGDVYIQTAAEKERFVFRKVPNPYGLKDMIMNMQKEMIKKETNELGEVIREEIHREIK